MGRRSSPSGKGKNPSAEKSVFSRRRVLFGAAPFVGGAGLSWLAPVWLTAYWKGAPARPAGGDLLRRGENRPTLPPTLFRGKVRHAYEVARQMSALLDKLYCYCNCQQYFAHKNLLSCYVDRHAAG